MISRRGIYTCFRHASPTCVALVPCVSFCTDHFRVGLLETVLFAKIRFHDTVSRGRLLNRFGKDLETIDSNQSDNFGRTVIYGLNTVVTVITVTVVGGPYFLVAILVLGSLYYRAARIYGQTSRDMRRLGKLSGPLRYCHCADLTV